MKSFIDQTKNSLKENRYYFLVIFIFFLVSYYHYIIVPMPSAESNAVKVAAVRQSTLSIRNPEKVYQNIIQPQEGDVFRLGMIVEVQKEQTLEIYLHSVFDEKVKVGEVSVKPVVDGAYQELIFTVPGRYQDVIVRLASPLGERSTWGDSNVYVYSFFVSRLDVKNATEISELQPTLFGVPETHTKDFFTHQKSDTLPKTIKMVFLSEDDFLKSILLLGEAIDQKAPGYSLALSSYDASKKSSLEELREISFSSENLKNFQEPNGEYLLPFPALLTKGQWYILTLTPDIIEDRSILSRLFPEKREIAPDFTGKKMATVTFGSHTTSTSGKKMLDFSRLEDLGRAFSYQFSLQGGESDFENLSQATTSIRFDQKENLVSGDKKHGEYFVYTFDTMKPFKMFSLRAEQSGTTTNGLQLEYSLDDTSWETVPFTQEQNGPQKFFLSLPGNTTSTTVTLRVSYVGQEKKTGSFGLRSLSVNAIVSKL